MRSCGVDLMRSLSRFAVIVAIGGVASACSSDVARFGDSPFSNPFKSGAGGEPTMTGSVPPKAAAVPSARVETQPLAPPQASAAPVYNRPSTPAPIASAPAPRPVAPARPVASGPAGWTIQGGTPVTVRTGDSLNLIATRYGVPASAILEANGLKSAAQVSPGRQIVIPVYNAGGVAAAPVRAKAAPAPQRQAGEAKPRFVQGPKAQEKPGSAKDRVRQAGAKTPEAKPDPKLAKAQPKPEPAKQAAKPELQNLGAVQPVKPALKAAEAQKPAQIEIAKTPAKSSAKEPEQTASIAPQATAYAPAPATAAAQPVGFRWPAKGRVIAGFGGSGGNEGINIAVPEGTSVKAAEDGTVAYAGSEVKGYGKLVLIRHDNGYVSAYAHNGEIAVKHGQKVKRGDTIAKSGQTGNVTSPQLHFEIRKGATPIDPMPHLQGG
jgi:murein DD-endopeptidase MepM/ murein hydrolase activator NlpD